MPPRKTKTFTSKVEQIAISHSGQELRYPPVEKVKVIIVDNVPELGRLTALRFLEWAQNNEGWTVSLPTGKTPIQFIKWISKILATWDNRETQKFLDKNGVDPGHKPDMKSFHFIQIDEFYPIPGEQHNSFFYYVNKFYIKGFNFDAKKALLINPSTIGIPQNETLESIWPDYSINLDLRFRQAKSSQEMKQKKVLETVDQFCTDYESKIRVLGGIGFFLGGIGPDGHIGFNVRGSDHYSTTRLTATNFESQAYAASNLGGMENSRKCLVITLGLQTIVQNSSTTAIIIASGETKAQVVRDAVERPKDNTYPATVLHDLINSSFYVTRGAASLLSERKYLEIQNSKTIPLSTGHRILIDLALKKNKSLTDLTKQDLTGDRSCREILDRLKESYKDYVHELEQDLQKRFNSAMMVIQNQTILHTAPRHNDLMLGYFPFLFKLIQEPSNQHYFNYLTSDSARMTSRTMYHICTLLNQFINRSEFRQLGQLNYFEPGNISARNQDVLLYLDGVLAFQQTLKNEAISRRLLRNLIEISEDDNFTNLQNRLTDLLNYFNTPYTGKKDLHYIQQIKAMMTEWESDVQWGHFGFKNDVVIHSRLGFYRRDLFTEEPISDRDVITVLNTLKRIKPTMLTVLLNPESTGVDTSYKVLQIMAQALRLYYQESEHQDIEIWGYRTIGSRFHLSEINTCIPVGIDGFAIADHIYMNSLILPAEISFPSYEYDGPLIELTKKIQVEQHYKMKTLLGQEYFLENQSPQVRSTKGLIYLKRMLPDEFWMIAEELKKIMENP